MTPRVQSRGDGKGASPLSRGKHWDCQAGGGVLSSPLWSTEEPPSLGGSRAADGRAAARSCQGWIISLAALGADTHGGERSPSLNLLHLLYALIFLQLLLKITGNLSCSLGGTLVDCLTLFLPFDTDVLGRVLPCAPDFSLYMQDMIKTFNHSCDLASTSFVIFAAEDRDL